MATGQGWRVLARMPDRTVGGLLRGASFTLNLRYNEVGSWTIQVPRESTPAGWPSPGAGAIFLRDERVVASGMLDTEPFDYSTEPGDEASGQGMYGLNGDTDLGRIAYRFVYPTPGSPWGSLQGDYYIEAPDRPETRLRVLVSRQAGPAALAVRQEAGLTIAADTGIPGANYSIRERFTELLEAARKIADFGSLRFDVLDQMNGNMQFQVYPISDKSGDVIFGEEFGNVTSLHVERIAPTASVALVAGGGELDNRSLHEFVNGDHNAAWGRREVFIDQRQVGEDDPVSGEPTEEQQIEYEKAGLEALEEGQEQTAVSAVVIDTDAVKWGRDYQLGDKVSVRTPFGAVSDVVRGVEISVDENGVEEITSTIGTTDVAIDDPMRRSVENILKRLSEIERGL